MKPILKKVSSAVMALAVMASAAVFDLPITVTVEALSAGGCDGTHGTEWENGDPITTGGSYYLESDVTLADEIEIGGGIDVTLCLNGHTVTAASNSRIFNIKNGSLTLCDCQGNGKLTGGSSDSVGGAVYIAQNCTFEMHGGTITNSSANEGGGVYVSKDADFEMTGGTITENTASHQGGGVYVSSSGADGGACRMSGSSTVSKNTVSGGGADNSGAGVYAAGSVTMNGGTISENYAEGSYGGGVCVSNSGLFIMKSGTISNNNADRFGGGVYVSNSGEFNMLGGSVSGNMASNGGGICMANGAGKVLLDGTVDITSNKADNLTDSNIYLIAEGDGTVKKITIGGNFAPTEKIGIHAQEKTECMVHLDAAEFDTGVTPTDISEFFKPDQKGQTVVYDDTTDKLQLFLEHNYGKWTITQAPTLSSPGSATHVCKNNSEHVETIELPPLSDTTVWNKEEKPDKNVYTSEYGTVETPSESGGSVGHLVVTADSSTAPDITDITESTDDTADSTENSVENDDNLGNTYDNPSTGTAMVYVPLAAAMIAVIAAVKRKKKYGDN